MPPTSHPSRSFGFTLIELLVAGAVGLIILIAILTTVDLQRGFHRNSDRLLSADSGASLALLAVGRDLENAGFHFPVATLAIRPRDNVAAPLPNGDGTTIPVTTLGSASAGVIQGTDAIDIITGNPATVGGFVNGIGAVGPSTIFNLDALDPLMPTDLDAGLGVVGPLLAFQAPGVRCVGKVTSAGGTAVTVTVFPDLEGDLTGAGTGVAGCPALDMSVYAVMTRKRYLIYQDSTGVFGLYVQNLKDPLNAQRLGVLGPPVLVAEGIEDMQISYNVGAGTWCNKGGLGDCDVMASLNSIQGIRIQMVSRGTDVMKRIGEFRPAVFNHPAGSVDDIPRLVMGTSTMFRNLVYVGP
jgi:hypothetical protein